MKNDFDFIKDKIEDSGVHAPAEMDESFVIDKLADVQPDPTPILTEVKPKKHHYALISGIAAAFVAIVALSVIGGILISQRITPVSEPTASAPSIKADIPLKTFSDYDEVKKQVKEIDSYNFSGSRNYGLWSDDSVDYNSESYESGSGSSGSSGSSSDSKSGGSGSGSESYSETYKQVEGVDEADIVKTDGKYIYVASENGAKGIDIYSATDDPVRVATIYPDHPSDPMKPSAYYEDDDDLDVFVEEMYLYGDKLIAVCMTRGEHFTYNTMAAVYDVSDIKNIKLADQFHQSGDYSTTRMIGDTLYLISEHSVYDGDFEIPVCYRGEEVQEIPVDCVYCTPNPTESTMLIVGGYSLSDGSSDLQSTAILGSVEDVYCNESNMYLYTTKWRYTEIVDYDYYDGGIIPDYYQTKDYEPITTDIYKVSLKDGIAFTAYGTVEGYLDSRYSLDEKNGYLRVAATTENAINVETNCLYVLDENLKEVGSVTGFAENESIQAVRYVGDVAYVITYEQTDPLFVIDLSVPAKPTILGEVKIDGFSTMLVPVDENTILGVGVYTEDSEYTTMQVQNGVKLALFDVSDKLHPKVLDEKSYRGCESEAVYEPRAFVYNPDRNDYLIPLNYYEYKNDRNWEYADTVVHGGALNFKIENGKIVEVARPEVKITRDYGDSIDRCLYVGDFIYLIYNGYYDETAVYAVKYQ